MILNLRHTGIVVRNLKKSISFYSILGFKLFSKEIEKGKYIDNIVGIDNVEIEIAKLKSPCGGLIELLQYLSHPMKKEIRNQPSNLLGCSHIAITVEDIENILIEIKQNGGSIVNKPIQTPDGKYKVAYTHDPEGVLIEVVQQEKHL